MSNPAFWLLLGSSSQVLITDGYWPLNAEDSSMTGVDEGLNCLGGGNP
jgi:hypothetical protein